MEACLPCWYNMSIRSFPRTRKEPRKRILLIPVVLTFGGTILSFIPPFQFIGTIVALTGVLTVFLVGMVFADLWASHRRTQQIIKERQERGLETSEETLEEIEDPFEDVSENE